MKQYTDSKFLSQLFDMTIDQFNNIKYSDILSVKCQCGAICQRKKRDCTKSIRKNTYFKCPECKSKKEKMPRISSLCFTCHTPIEITQRNNKKHKKHFCNTKCRLIYLNSTINKPKIKKCLNCDNNFMPKGRHKAFCSPGCRKFHNTQKYILEWQRGNIVGWTGAGCMIKGFIRRYLFQKYNNKCCRCGWASIHPVTNKIPLEVNHIDGNAKNCVESNLELLCPNCHSLTPNYKALNKNGTRWNPGTKYPEITKENQKR